MEEIWVNCKLLRLRIASTLELFYNLGMAGEILRTQGIVLAIHPWSRTSHVVTWLTPDHGVVSTLVKGAVRPKSAFLGQYDLFYICDLLYYARPSGELHALREVKPTVLHDELRGHWRETSLAGYASMLIKDHAPPDHESSSWYSFLTRFLSELSLLASNRSSGATLASGSTLLLRKLVALEMGILCLAGLRPDFSELDPAAIWTPFAIDRGRCGNGTRTVRITPQTVIALTRPDARTTTDDAICDAIRFLGVFLSFHLTAQPEIRRSLVKMLEANVEPCV